LCRSSGLSDSPVLILDTSILGLDDEESQPPEASGGESDIGPKQQEWTSVSGNEHRNMR